MNDIATIVPWKINKTDIPIPLVYNSLIQWRINKTPSLDEIITRKFSLILKTQGAVLALKQVVAQWMAKFWQQELHLHLQHEFCQ